MCHQMQNRERGSVSDRMLRAWTAFRNAHRCHPRAAAALCAAFVVAGQARGVTVRWWMSRAVITAIGIDSRQVEVIEHQYERESQLRAEASEQVISLTEAVREHLRDGQFDDVRPLTEQLTAARRRQCDLRRRALDGSEAALTPVQRERLHRLIATRELLD